MFPDIVHCLCYKQFVTRYLRRKCHIYPTVIMLNNSCILHSIHSSYGTLIVITIIVLNRSDLMNGRQVHNNIFCVETDVLRVSNSFMRNAKKILIHLDR